MNAESGATEAFQLSNVAVQMVAEGLLSTVPSDRRRDSGNDDNGRFLSAAHPVLVDGKETNQLDGLLCLINTALLSRVGDYAGPQPPDGGGKPPASVVKKSGGLAARTRKALTAALGAGGNGDGDDDDQELLRLLSDYTLLVALHDLIGPKDCRTVCATVKKWTRQKRGTRLDRKVRERLRRLALEGS
jgi:hypothetical protein